MGRIRDTRPKYQQRNPPPALAAVTTHLLFISFVAIAVYAQTVTGFALALILLGLVGVFDLVPVPDAANAVTVMIIVNAATFFTRRKGARLHAAIRPAVLTNLLGTLVGMALLTYLAANAYQVLRMALGASIVACAYLLWRAAAPLATTAPPRYFACAGSISGVLGGMFSAPGPPLVYAVYRQPWPAARVQEALIFMFGAGAVLRLLVMVAAGQFSAQAVLLTIEAVPVVLLVTALAANREPPVSAAVLRNVVSVFLVLSGVTMVISSAQILLQGVTPA